MQGLYESLVNMLVAATFVLQTSTLVVNHGVVLE